MKYFWAILIFLTSNVHFSHQKLEMVMKTLRQCPDANNTMLVLENAVLERPEPDKFVLNGVLNVRKKIEGPMKITLNFFKCPDEVGQGCDLFYSYECKDYCKESINKNSGNFIVGYADMIGLRKGCPMVKERYNMKTVEIVANDHIKTILSVGKYWVGRVEGTYNNQLVMCQSIEGYMKSTRKVTSRYG